MDKLNLQKNNITVRKIPNMLLGRCEFGKEDYSLNIVNMPVEENEQQPEPLKVHREPARRIKDKTQRELFVKEDIVEEYICNWPRNA